jgi:GT2 family glycosyltransferase
MPKIIYPNGSNQKLAKLSPGILDLLLRRTPFLQFFFNNFLIKYELRHYKYDKIIDIPFLSGCFLLCKTEFFKNIGGFDENLFLYMEDVDLTRRFISYGKRSVVYPFAYAIHDHEYKKIHNLNSFKIFFNSAFYYFNKWGWFLDKERKIMNTKTLSQII